MGNIVVLHSGGQDSTTSLAWAIKQWGRERIYPLLFDYGQRHSIEMACALRVCKDLGVRTPEVLTVEALDHLGGAALTNSDISVSADAKRHETLAMNEYAAAHGLPSTFVPGRNMLFFTLAAAYGAKIGASELVTGVCQADRAGYPDCRAEFVGAAERALSLALDQTTRIIAPLLRRTKAETWALAEKLDVLDLVINKTHTCYEGVHDDEHLHEWGYGCGECPACEERARGYEKFREDSMLSRLP
jgi:7-cyano-7-deazaguanine synthase